ncbi:hypothetical protein TRFO_30880 [Tritrichomonas foetus]|uniref:WD40 repeat-containing protein SMU1 n=1 Tax=Tritrichomonas foetus TaxID=1144522 RepID=A0A1J4JXA3_9EUKA|nr:hypothetical protein TRFO_30880 [Tritrichomonas foetus]|eukprot:OHT02164.1 hypothetical protein TRFO_30880 [Tritrichomonas foetus]
MHKYLNRQSLPIRVSLPFLPRIQTTFDSEDPSIKREILMMIVQYLEENGYRSSAMILRNEASFSTKSSVRSVDLTAVRNAVVSDDWTQIDNFQIDKYLHPRLVYSIYRHRYYQILLSGDSHDALQFLSTRLRPFRAFEDQAGDFDQLCFLLVDAASPSRTSPIPDIEASLQRTLNAIDSQLSVVSIPVVDNSLPSKRLTHLIQQAAAHQLQSFPLCCIKSIINDFVPATLPDFSGKRLKGCHTGNIKAISFIPRSEMLISGGSDSNVVLWDVKKCQQVSQLKGHKGRVWSIATTEKYAATASADSTIRIWDIENQSLSATFSAHTDDVYAVDIDNCGSKVISGGFDRSVIIWDVNAGVPINTIRGAHKGSVTSICFDSTGNMAITGGKDMSIQIWDLRNCIAVRTLSPVLGEVSSVNTDRSFNHVLAATKNSTNRIYDLRMSGSSTLLKGHKNTSKHFVRARFGYEGRIVVGGSDDGKIYSWDAGTGILAEKLEAHKGGVFDVIHSQDMQLFASCGEDSVIRLWGQRQMK